MSSLSQLARSGIALEGNVFGVPWRLQHHRQAQFRLLLGTQTIQLYRDRIGSFVTHRLVGRWTNPADIARTIVLYDPDFPSPDIPRRLV